MPIINNDSKKNVQRIVHCDWSTNANKRWMTIATLIDVVLDYREEGRHLDPNLNHVEGWILGQNQ